MSTSQALKDALRPGTRFGRYFIGKPLGRGGMGTVYEAVHITLNKRVAIKTLGPRVADSPEFRARFLREGRMAARIQHPNIVDIYDVGAFAGTPYMVMELLNGVDLGRLVRKCGPLYATAATDVLLPILSGLHVAHRQGIIHRDLKPTNIFLARSPDGTMTPKLLDFGVSKDVDEPDAQDSLTHSGTLLGTPSFMSPEQAHGGQVLDARSDQYSFGVVLYWCVTGERPFAGGSKYQTLRKIVEGEFAPPRERRPDLATEFEAIILRAMARRPEDRFATLIDLGRALMPFASLRVATLLEPAFAAAGPPDTPLFAPALEPPSAARPSDATELAPPLLVSAPVESFATEAPIHAFSDPRSLNAVSYAHWLPGLFTLALTLLLIGMAVAYHTKTKDTPPARASARSGRPQLVRIDGPQRTGPPPVPTTYRVTVDVTPESAKIELDGRPVAVGTFSRTFTKSGRAHRLRISADGYVPTEIAFTDEPPPPKLRLRQREPNDPPPQKQRPKRRPSRTSKPPARAQKPKPPQTPPAPKYGPNESPILR